MITVSRDGLIEERVSEPGREGLRGEEETVESTLEQIEGSDMARVGEAVWMMVQSVYRLVAK